MLRLTQLELERFRSFVEPARIAFPASGLVQVRGNGSGCGKSSLFLGIAEALCVCPVPATQLKSWFSDEPRRVSASFADDKGLTFTSIRESGMSLVVNGEALTGAPKFLQEKLRDLVGVKSLDWLIPLTYRPQNAGSFFLGLSDAEKKEFLSGVLGLDVIEDALERAEDELKTKQAAVIDAQRGFDAANGRFIALREAAAVHRDFTDQEISDIAFDVANVEAEERAIRAKIAAIDKKIAAHGKPECTPEEKARIAELNGAVSAPNPMIGELERRLAAVDARITKTMQTWAQAQRLFQEQRMAQQAWKNKIRGLENELSGNAAMIAQCEAKIAKIMDRSCPTCNQHLADDFLLREHETALSKLFTARQEAIKDLEAAKAMDIDPTPPERPDMSKDEAAKAALRQRLEGQWAGEAQRQRQTAEEVAQIVYMAQERHAAELAVVRTERDLIAATLRDLAERAAVCRNARDNQEKQSAAAAKARQAAAVAGDDAAKAKEVLNAALAEVAVEEDFIALVGHRGFLGSIFDEVLLDISQETNRLLAMLPNVAHLSMYLSSSKTAATSKKQKKAITPVFRAHGHEVGDAWQKVFSGGQVTAIQLAIDLAVAQVVGKRTGVTPGWLILDEPFVGLPADEVEQIMSVLHVLSQDRLVLVVHHDSQSQEMFGQTIEVVCENGRSTVKTS